MNAKAVSRARWKIGDMLVEDTKDSVLEGESALDTCLVENAEFHGGSSSRPQRHIRAAPAVGRHAQRIGVT
jgi:hypothetical protein